MNFSIASVTVAYNAECRLQPHLGSLLRQSYPLREIIVVDNASIDGTVMLLAERYPQVTVLKMPENLGMAGAWAAGLRYAALEKGHDWVWSFDDDSIPDSDVLEALLEGNELLNDVHGNVGMLAPMPIHGETGIAYPPQLWRDGFVKPPAEVLQQPLWLADLVITSGCMVRRDVVERVGLPRADFFMDFFDFEYCLRMGSRGYKIAVVSRAKLGHKIGNSRGIRLPGYARLWMNQPPWREYYIGRNLAYTGWWLYPSNRTKKFVLRHLAIHAGGIVLFSSRKLRSLIRMVQGFWDGRRGRLGVRFLPNEEVR